MRHTLRFLTNLLGVVALLFSTTPGLSAQAQALLEAACPCQECREHHGQAAARQHANCPSHSHSPRCTSDHCHHHDADHDDSALGEDGALLADTAYPLCPFCPAGTCHGCCTGQPPCDVPSAASAPGPWPCLSEPLPDKPLLLPPPLAHSFMRPPRA